MRAVSELPPDPFVPRRPAWVTVVMVCAGVLGAPLAILGLAILASSLDLDERAGSLLAIAVFLSVAAIVTAVRAVRPLGVGMVLGALSLGAVLVLSLSRNNPA